MKNVDSTSKLIISIVVIFTITIVTVIFQNNKIKQLNNILFNSIETNNKLKSKLETKIQSDYLNSHKEISLKLMEVFSKIEESTNNIDGKFISSENILKQRFISTPDYLLRYNYDTNSDEPLPFITDVSLDKELIKMIDKHFKALYQKDLVKLKETTSDEFYNVITEEYKFEDLEKHNASLLLISAKNDGILNKYIPVIIEEFDDSSQESRYNSTIRTFYIGIEKKDRRWFIYDYINFSNDINNF